MLGSLAGLVALLWIHNTSLFVSGGEPFLVAHRGAHQRFPHGNAGADTCTARLIYPPEHGFLENTIPSMRAAFMHGARYVELDVHPTTDGEFAVFHDWELDCRTNGSGRTRDHSLAQLKQLDIGYGYTADGQTYPFRGSGAGLMPSLAEVLSAFPTQRFLIHIKSNDPEEGRALARYLRTRALSPERLMVYGGDRPVQTFRESMPQLRTTSRQVQMACGRDYLLIGWTGYVPRSCRNVLLIVPINYGFMLWGWPHRFVARMERARSIVVVSGAYQRGEGFTTGIDTPEDLERIPDEFAGGIWTNRIEMFESVDRQGLSTRSRFMGQRVQ